VVTPNCVRIEISTGRIHDLLHIGELRRLCRVGEQ
jgi:hypothetical protein